MIFSFVPTKRLSNNNNNNNNNNSSNNNNFVSAQKKRHHQLQQQQKRPPLARLFQLLVRLFLGVVAAIRRPVLERKAQLAAKLRRRPGRYCLRILPRKT
ncbi:hypothetical protein TKK_0017956 [Trichogramma kaykai]